MTLFKNLYSNILCTSNYHTNFLARSSNPDQGVKIVIRFFFTFLFKFTFFMKLKTLCHWNWFNIKYHNLIILNLKFETAVTLYTDIYQHFAWSKYVLSLKFAFNGPIKKEKKILPHWDSNPWKLKFQYGSSRCTKCWSTQFSKMSYL